MSVVRNRHHQRSGEKAILASRVVICSALVIGGDWGCSSCGRLIEVLGRMIPGPSGS